MGDEQAEGQGCDLYEGQGGHGGIDSLNMCVACDWAVGFFGTGEHVCRRIGSRTFIPQRVIEDKRNPEIINSVPGRRGG